jgi:hypothetical protein
MHDYRLGTDPRTGDLAVALARARVLKIRPVGPADPGLSASQAHALLALAALMQ